jgi:hypothetical protein
MDGCTTLRKHQQALFHHIGGAGCPENARLTESDGA